jgi:hypothetical protein
LFEEDDIESIDDIRHYVITLKATNEVPGNVQKNLFFVQIEVRPIRQRNGQRIGSPIDFSDSCMVC